MIDWSNCQSKCTLSSHLTVRAFYKGNRIPWMEDILLSGTVEKYLIGWFLFSNTKPLICAVYGQKTTETSRHNFYFIYRINEILLFFIWGFQGLLRIPWRPWRFATEKYKRLLLRMCKRTLLSGKSFSLSKGHPIKQLNQTVNTKV